MYLKDIKLSNFKSYGEVEISFSHNINCLVGNNGVGKTNLLDAIYYLSFTKSYFNSLDNQNIKYNEPFLQCMAIMCFWMSILFSKCRVFKNEDKANK